MKRTKKNLAREFICPKCRGRGGVAQEVTLPTSGSVPLLAFSLTRFHAVSCVLCGYTEFYSRAATVRAEEPEANPALAEGSDRV